MLMVDASPASTVGLQCQQRTRDHRQWEGNFGRGLYWGRTQFGHTAPTTSFDKEYHPFEIVPEFKSDLSRRHVRAQQFRRDKLYQPLNSCVNRQPSTRASSDVTNCTKRLNSCVNRQPARGTVQT
ncbi:hypothetical protein J6590_083766 [Homalodisca vitripennis]|nr:hypothetical protein J6590_083766 [Homalodisca vitripennis]